MQEIGYYIVVLLALCKLCEIVCNIYRNSYKQSRVKILQEKGRLTITHGSPNVILDIFGNYTAHIINDNTIRIDPVTEDKE